MWARTLTFQGFSGISAGSRRARRLPLRRVGSPDGKPADRSRCRSLADASCHQRSAGGQLPQAARAAPARSHAKSDRFFRHLVAGMRNGVLAITRDGIVAEINAEAQRIFQLKRSQSSVGRHFSEVLAKHPDMVRVLHSAFELSHLPNRAELRLKTTGKVIGYTLSHVQDERGRSTGVALFFKDLTKVEQLEERERLRDRLVALGEMAAAIAHEVKNPLAGIEVMAGLLKRQRRPIRPTRSRS